MYGSHLLGLFPFHGSEVSGFPKKDRMTKTAYLPLKGKMQLRAAFVPWNLNVQVEYVTPIQAIGTLRPTVAGERFVKIGTCLGYYVDKGWMCVQVFLSFVKASSQRDVNLFPTTMIRMRTSFDPGQFGQEKNLTRFPMSAIPCDIDEGSR